MKDGQERSAGKVKGGRKAVGSHDVARLAGVSRSAVSRAFTPGAYIAPETRRKVMEAAELLNYRPNAIARSLSKKRSGLVGLIGASLDNPFYAQLLAALGSELQEHGYATLLLVARTENLDDLIPQLLSYQVDGVILPAVHLSSQMAVELEKSGRPVVLVNRYLQEEIVSSVSGDNRGGGRVVGEMLARAGHQRIAFMAGETDTSSSRDRLEGFRDGLAAHGRSIYASDVGQYRHAEAIEATRRLLSLSPRPDAIFCANDVMAMAALEIARVEFGLSIPDQLAIVGYDNSDQAGWPPYQLTSVDQHLGEMARLSVDLLMAKLASGDGTVEHRVVPATLIRRATTLPA